MSVAQMNLAGFLQNGGMPRKPDIGSEWATNVVPEPQRAHGRVLDPSAFLTMQQPPQSPSMFMQQPFANTGFADFLRNTYLPQLGR